MSLLRSRLALPRPAARAARAVLAACALCAAAPAVAAEGGDVERTLIVVELRAGEAADPLTAKYMAEIIAAFKDENPGDVILVDGKTTADKVRRDRDQVPLAISPEGRALLGEARKKGTDLLDSADFPGAIKALTAAEGRYRAAMGAPGADDKLRDEYLDVLAQLATAHVAAGDKNAAAEVFRTVITTFGLKAKVTDDNYRPDVVALFQAEVKKVEKMPKGGVDVSSVPAGARIILGGNDRGATPMVVGDLIPGTYALRLQSGKDSSLLHRVKIDAGATVKVSYEIGFESHLVVEEDHVGLMYADMRSAESRLQGDAVNVGKDVEANLVCAVGVVDGKLVSYLVDVSGARIVRYSNEVKVPKVGISKRAVNKVLVTILGEKADKNVVEGPIQPAARKPWHGSTMGWAAAGGAAVGLGVGIALSSYLNLANIDYCKEASGNPCSGKTHQQVEDSQAYKDFQSSASTKGVVSGLGLGVGVGLGALAGYLFWNESNQPADGPAATLYRGVPGVAGPVQVVLPPVRLDAGPVRYVAR